MHFFRIVQIGGVEAGKIIFLLNSASQIKIGKDCLLSKTSIRNMLLLGNCGPENENYKGDFNCLMSSAAISSINDDNMYETV